MCRAADEEQITQRAAAAAKPNSRAPGDSLSARYFSVLVKKRTIFVLCMDKQLEM